MTLHVEFDRETDRRWIAEVVELPGVMAYGKTRAEALAAVKVLALRVIAERLETGDERPSLKKVAFSQTKVPAKARPRTRAHAAA